MGGPLTPEEEFERAVRWLDRHTAQLDAIANWMSDYDTTEAERGIARETAAALEQVTLALEQLHRMVKS